MIENLESLENLEELYLSHNGVERIEGLEHNVSGLQYAGRVTKAFLEKAQNTGSWSKFYSCD